MESTKGVDEEDGEDHDDGEGEEGDFAPLLHLATEDDRVETALLESGSTVFVVLMMMMMLFGHFFCFLVVSG